MNNIDYVYNNKLSFEESMWVFARSMPFLESFQNDEPIPDKIERSDSYDYNLKFVEKQLAIFANKSDLEKRAFLNRLAQDSVNFNNKIIDGNNKKLEFLSELLEKIQAWNCCEEFKSLKDFAIRQTELEIDHLKSNNNYFGQLLSRRTTIESYRQNLLDDIIFCKRSIEREEQKIAEHNQYLDKMREYFPLKK